MATICEKNLIFFRKMSVILLFIQIFKIAGCALASVIHAYFLRYHVYLLFLYGKSLLKKIFNVIYECIHYAQ